MSKQTAVEWLYDEFKPFLQDYSRGDIEDNKYFIRILTQAKAMEREQIEESYGVGHNDGCAYMTDGKKEFENAEQYYNSTYKGGEQ